MRERFELRWATLILGVFATMGVLVGGGTAYAAPQYSLTCSSCHGMPPLDDTTRNPNTGGFVGSHQTHQPSGATINDCAICHNASGYTTSHMNGQIGFQSNINNSPKAGGGQYKVGGSQITFKNQTSVPALGSCSSVNCHFESDTPQWGSAKFSSSADCSACHTAPGPSGSHTKHDQYFSFANNGCVNCHPDYRTSLKFSHATSAGNAGRNILVTLSEGSYSGTGANYLPSQSASRTIGSCTNLYCHSDGTKSSGYTVQTVPTWSVTSGTLNCNSCHKADSTLSSGSHNKHLSTTITSGLACYKCHSATVNSSGSIISTADHVNRFVTIKFNSSTTAANGTYAGQQASSTSLQKSPGTTPGTCSNVYCHSFGTAITGTFRVMSTARWGSALPGNCTACHGGDATNPSFRIMSTGRHQKHMRGQYSYGCAVCHATTVSANTTIADPSKHINAQINVGFSGIAGGSAVYTVNGHVPGNPGTADDTCRNVYCHSNAQVQAGETQAFRNLTGSKRWGQAGTLGGCSGCHSTGSTTTGQFVLSGKHLAHLNLTVNPSIGTVLSCNDCHANGGTNLNRANHANGFINFSSALGGNQASLTVSTGVCSNAYCHSDGKGTLKSMATNNWFSGATLDCKGCHGSDATPAFTGQFGEPNYANAGAGQPKANSHHKHVLAAADCSRCHRATTTDGVNILSGSTTHANKAIDVRFTMIYGNLSGVYNSTTKTCSNTYCHSSGTPTWGANGTITCTSCHGGVSGGLSTTHTRHISGGAGFSYTCDKCHVNTVAAGSTSAINPTTGSQYHVNGAKDVNFDSTNPGAGYAAPTCSTVYCHSNGKGTYASPQWGTASTGACGTCHNTTPAIGGALISTNGHFQHFSSSAVSYGPNLTQTNVTSCQACHTYTGENGATHVNGSVDVPLTNCTANCHKQIASVGSVWTSGPVACESCHTTTGGALSVINGITAPDKTSFSAWGHGQIGAGKPGQLCLDCHDRNQRHISKTAGVSNRVLSGLGTGNTRQACDYCHNDPAKVTNSAFRNMSTHFTSYPGGGQTMACQNCHDPHGATNNLSMIKASINYINSTTWTITYTNRDTGWVNTTTNRGLCQVCHTKTKYYRAGVAENGHPTTACYSCHTHNAKGGAFKPSGSCDACHGYPPVPRNVAGLTFGTMNNYTSARFEDYSGGGGAHVVGKHVPPTARPSEGWANCTLCHSAGDAQHKRILPIRNNVANVTVLPQQSLRRFNPAVQIIYTTAKLVNPPNNVTGTCYNASCHFSKSPKWSSEK